MKNLGRALGFIASAAWLIQDWKKAGYQVNEDWVHHLSKMFLQDSFLGLRLARYLRCPENLFEARVIL